jgi:hypothetical protein
VSRCSASDMDFLLVGCVGGTATAAAAEGTASGTAADVDVDSGAHVPKGDSARTAGVNCLTNRDNCCSRPAVHQSCAFGLPSPGTFSQSL